MSWRASAWAKKTRGHGRSHGQKLLLMILADYADPDTDLAWPSQRVMAEDAEMSIRTVQWCVKRLDTQGYVTTLQKGNQYQPTIYRLNVTPAQAHEPATSEPVIIAGAKVNPHSQTVNPQTQTGEPAIPVCTNHQEPPIEPSSPMYEGSDWLRVLREIPGWTDKVDVPKEQILVEWASSKGFSGTHREQTANALVAKWDGKKWKDPVATFRNWMLKSLQGGDRDRVNGHHRDGSTYQRAPGRTNPFARYGPTRGEG